MKNPDNIIVPKELEPIVEAFEVLQIGHEAETFLVDAPIIQFKVSDTIEVFVTRYDFERGESLEYKKVFCCYVNWKVGLNRWADKILISEEMITQVEFFKSEIESVVTQRK